MPLQARATDYGVHCALQVETRAGEGSGGAILEALEWS